MTYPCIYDTRLGLTRIFIIVYVLPNIRAIDQCDLFSLLITKHNATIDSVDSQEWTLTTCSVVIMFWRLCYIMDTHCVVYIVPHGHGTVQYVYGHGNVLLFCIVPCGHDTLFLYSATLTIQCLYCVIYSSSFAVFVCFVFD